MFTFMMTGQSEYGLFGAGMPDGRQSWRTGSAVLLQDGVTILVMAINTHTSYSGTQALGETWLYNTATDTWAPTGAISNTSSPTRNFMVAIALPNGKVLSICSFPATNRKIGTDLYDPATGVWTPSTDLVLGDGTWTGTGFSFYLSTYDVVLLDSDNVLFVVSTKSGQNSTYEGSLTSFVYNITSGTWSGGTTIASLADYNLYAGKLIELDDGSVFMTWARQGTTWSAEEGVITSRFVARYALGSWTTAASIPAPSYTEYAIHVTKLPSGKVLACLPSESNPTTDVSIYDPDLDTWTAAAPLNLSWRHAGFVPATDGIILVGARFQAFRNVERYDEVADTWSSLPMRAASNGLSLNVWGQQITLHVVNGFIYVMVGASDSWPGGGEGPQNHGINDGNGSGMVEMLQMPE